MSKQRGRPIELSPAWYLLAQAAGSVEQLAKLFQCSTRTVQRSSKKNSPPSDEMERIVNEIAKKLNVPSPYINRLPVAKKRTG